MDVQILTYHALSLDRTTNKYTVMRENFGEHMRFLSQSGYTSLLVDDYFQFLVDPLSVLPRRGVVVTFDDGDESNYTVALPILKQYGLKATFFVTSRWIGLPGYLTPGQLCALKAEGMSIQSHARTHTFLDKMSPASLYEELRGSKDDIESFLGDKISFVSVPGGRYNRDVVRTAVRSDYSALFCSTPCYRKRFGEFYVIGRCMVKDRHGAESFSQFLDMGRLRTIRARSGYLVKYLLRKLVGNTIYHSMWKRYASP